MGDTGSILVPVCVHLWRQLLQWDGAAGDTISGVRQDRLGTPVLGCCRTRQLGDTVSGHSPHATGMTRGGWAGSAGAGGADGGCLSPNPASPPPAAQGPHAAACPGVHPRNLGMRGGRLPPCPLTPRMIQALFCFSSARRRGQPDGWRWLPRRDKTARLSRHNRSVRLLARPRGHGPGAGCVLGCA